MTHTLAQLAEIQREEVSAYERSVAVFSGLAADYERKLTEARARLAETERHIRRARD
jgi:hypothetical protein